MSQSSSELVGEVARTSVSSGTLRPQYDDQSIRSNASTKSGGGSFKRRSRILIKIIPFARDPPPTPSAAEQSQRFGTFPRTRGKHSHEQEEVEMLAERFSDLNTLASPPLSASSFKTSFSMSQSGSTPATSPEMGGQNELPRPSSSSSYGRKSGCYGRRLKGASSRESVRSIFSSNSSSSLKAALSQAEENEWEKTLEEAASRASWHSSINHRPRPHNQSTWPKAFAPSTSSSTSSPAAASTSQGKSEGLLLEHMFVDATGEDDVGYAESSYSGYPVDGSRQGSVAESLASRPSISKFGSLPRMKGRRSSISRVNPALGQVLGTSSLGRATTLRRRQQAVQDVWSMGYRRRSSAQAGGSFLAGGATRMMPTIPQGHSRENSRADGEEEEEDLVLEAPSWAGIDPYSQPDVFSRGYSFTSTTSSTGGLGAGVGRHDSLSSDGSGEFIPLRFGRRESQDDLALI